MLTNEPVLPKSLTEIWNTMNKIINAFIWKKTYNNITRFFFYLGLFFLWIDESHQGLNHYVMLSCWLAMAKNGCIEFPVYVLWWWPYIACDWQLKFTLWSSPIMNISSHPNYMDFLCSLIIWQMIIILKGLDVKSVIDNSVINGPKCNISFHVQDLCELVAFGGTSFKSPHRFK